MKKNFTALKGTSQERIMEKRLFWQ